MPVVSAQLKNNDGDYGTVNISDYGVIELDLPFFAIAHTNTLSHCTLCDRDPSEFFPS